MSARKVVIVVEGGVANVDFVSDGIDVTILDMDEPSKYLYKPSGGKEVVCEVISANGDGTVDLSSIGVHDGKRSNRVYRNVPSELLEYYGSVDDDDDYLDDEEEENW